MVSVHASRQRKQQLEVSPSQRSGSLGSDVEMRRSGSGVRERIGECRRCAERRETLCGRDSGCPCGAASVQCPFPGGVCCRSNSPFSHELRSIVNGRFGNRGLGSTASITQRKFLATSPRRVGVFLPVSLLVSAILWYPPQAHRAASKNLGPVLLDGGDVRAKRRACPPKPTRIDHRVRWSFPREFPRQATMSSVLLVSALE